MDNQDHAFVASNETKALNRCLAYLQVTILILNCPPDRLLLFLKTLVAKVARHRTEPIQQSSARERLFMNGKSYVLYLIS